MGFLLDRHTCPAAAPGADGSLRARSRSAAIFGAEVPDCTHPGQGRQIHDPGVSVCALRAPDALLFLATRASSPGNSDRICCRCLGGSVVLLRKEAEAAQ